MVVEISIVDESATSLPSLDLSSPETIESWLTKLLESSEANVASLWSLEGLTLHLLAHVFNHALDPAIAKQYAVANKSLRLCQVDSVFVHAILERTGVRGYCDFCTSTDAQESPSDSLTYTAVEKQSTPAAIWLLAAPIVARCRVRGVLAVGFASENRDKSFTGMELEQWSQVAATAFFPPVAGEP